MAKVGLKDKLKAKAPELFEALYKDYRPELDARITVLDLSYEALKVNVYRGTSVSQRDLAVYNKVYSNLQTVVREALSKRTYASLNDPKLQNYFSANNPQPYPVLIDSGTSFFVVGKNFDAIRNFVTKNISKDPRLKSSRFGESTRYQDVLNKAGIPSGDVKKSVRSKVDIGHIPSSGSENLTSPLEEKLQAVLRVSMSNGNQRLAKVAQQSIQELYDIQATVSYDFKNTTPEAISTARDVLGTGYVVVTLHTEKKNNTFSSRELEIFNKLTAEMAMSINLLDVPGSNTILEDIEEALVGILKNGKSKLKKHKTNKAKVTQKKTRKANTQAAGLSKAPKIAEEALFSLSSLQVLLNTYLQDVVSANMGDGSSRNVLNYRTGRFAGSAEVTRLSQSRDGMITAFYTYMKNPYATFSAGGRQQNPKTRDPKLLISKSIREIAAEMVSNRLRAVLV
jgi:hypothetical protein